MKQKTKQLYIFLIGVIAAIGFDQWTKYQAVLHLKAQPPFVLWDGVFEFFYSENRGAAFGILQGRQSFFFLVAAVVTLAIGYLMYRMPVKRRYLPLQICLGLILSGAIGNMIDRITLGYVVDFLYFKLINFPIFNVADCYVTVATALLMILVFFYYKEEEFGIFSWKGESA